MNYLRIENNGLLCAEDLMLIGSSSKRDQSDKIGFFGSGWKYALSWLLRNESAPIIFSGDKEIKIDFEITMHRNNAVRVITVDSVKTSLTTDMGPKWSGWMAIREIVSNAIDEGGYKMRTDYSPEFKPEEGKTVIYIPLNQELANVIVNFNNYFSFDRKPDFILPGGKVYIKSEKSPVVVYRKGIRCIDTKTETLLDFDINELNINEDRLATFYDFENGVKKMIDKCDDAKLLKLIIEEENESYLPYYMNDNVLDCIKTLIDSGTSFTTYEIKKFTGKLFSDPNSLTIRQSWYEKLKDLKLITSKLWSFGNVHFIRTDERETDDVDYYLKEFNVNIELQSGSCSVDAHFADGIGLIKSDTKLNAKQIASMILSKIDDDDWAKMLGVTMNDNKGNDDLPF